MSDTLFEKALRFLQQIGIPTEYCSLAPENCFLPGLFINEGRILIDKALLQYPGDQ